MVLILSLSKDEGHAPELSERVKYEHRPYSPCMAAVQNATIRLLRCGITRFSDCRFAAPTPS
jgi:hypothetical protein